MRCSFTIQRLFCQFCDLLTSKRQGCRKLQVRKEPVHETIAERFLLGKHSSYGDLMCYLRI